MSTTYHSTPLRRQELTLDPLLSRDTRTKMDGPHLEVVRLDPHHSFSENDGVRERQTIQLPHKRKRRVINADKTTLSQSLEGYGSNIFSRSIRKLEMLKIRIKETISNLVGFSFHHLQSRSQTQSVNLSQNNTMYESLYRSYLITWFLQFVMLNPCLFEGLLPIIIISDDTNPTLSVVLRNKNDTTLFTLKSA